MSLFSKLFRDIYLKKNGFSEKILDFQKDTQGHCKSRFLMNVIGQFRTRFGMRKEKNFNFKTFLQRLSKKLGFIRTKEWLIRIIKRIEGNKDGNLLAKTC